MKIKEIADLCGVEEQTISEWVVSLKAGRQ